MTNLEKWMFYCKDVCSPESFIKWGWYYTVAAALQRRVWIMDRPIYPNLYIVMVGPAGVGKGMVIAPVTDLLKHHPYSEQRPNGYQSADGFTEQDIETLNYQVSSSGKSGRPKEKPLLIPVAASATTYEALVRHMSTSTRIVTYKEGTRDKIYAHCSSCFSLEELGSLFRQHTEDVVQFLLETYDCRDYTYDTKTQGKDVIKRCCVSILAGTTPSFMERCFSEERLAEGFASRTIFINESKNRFNRAHIDLITPEQEKAYAELLSHIKDLASLFGKIHVSKEVLDYVSHWWDQEANGITRANKSQKLDYYYARKNLHLYKTAMAIHFSESLSMELTMDDITRARAELTIIERTMHTAVTLDNKNPLFKVQKEIVRFLRQYGPQSEGAIVLEFIGSCSNGLTGLKECLEILVDTKQIERKKIGNAHKWALCGTLGGDTENEQTEPTPTSGV